MKNQKWLIRKLSGSRKRHQYNGPDYRDIRNTKYQKDVYQDGSLLPKHVSMNKGRRHQRRMDTSLIARFLHSRVGVDFDTVYSEVLARIQPKYRDDYKQCIFWYVETHVQVIDGVLYGIDVISGGLRPLPLSKQSTFYVDPETNKLKKISDYGTIR